jgi:hypothetical protein
MLPRATTIYRHYLICGNAKDDPIKIFCSRGDICNVTAWKSWTAGMILVLLRNFFSRPKAKTKSMGPPGKNAASQSRFLQNQKHEPDDLFGLFYLKNRQPSHFENKFKR